MKKTILSLLVALMATTGANAQETLTVYDGTGTSQHIPMHGYDFDSYTKSECIIPASVLTAMEGGTITAITFYVKEVDGMNSTFSPANQKVFLKEVSETALGSSYSGMDDATVVFDGTLPMPTTGGYTISFSQGYTYNGGNLLIGVYNDAKGLYNVVTWYGNNNQSDRVSAYGYNYNSLDNVGFTKQNFLPKTTFTYTPAPAGPTTSGITWNVASNSGTFLMPAYDVEVNTELWYRLSETASDNETKYGTKTNVFLERTLQAGGWNTFCAPFAIADPASVFGEGVQVKAFSGSSLSGNTLTLNFTDAATIAAATPYLIKLPGESNVDLTADGKEFEGVTQNWTPVDVNPDEGVATFKAALTPVSMTANDKTILFVTGGNALTFPNTAGDMKAFRAYFQLSQSMDVRAFSLNFDDETTGIQGIGQSDNARFDNSVYDLQGRRVAKPAKGLYIVNGKKTVVK